MSNLESLPCIPCRTGGAAASAAEIFEWLSQLPEWSTPVVDDVQRLVRIFPFKNFRQALDFTNQVGAIAEAEQHHPELLTAWGKVTVSWWTHKIGGLHRNDFIMAAKTERLFSGN